MKALCAPVHEPHPTVYATKVRFGAFSQREKRPVDSQKLLVRLRGPLWGLSPY